MDIENKIRQHFASKAGVGTDELPASNESLLLAGVLDSLGMMDLISVLEEEFGLTLADDDLMPENFETVDAIVRLVKLRMD
jgi:acyl carrier protein